MNWLILYSINPKVSNVIPLKGTYHYISYIGLRTSWQQYTITLTSQC